MLVRFRVLLPFPVYLSPKGLEPESWTDGGSRYVLHPPMHSAIEPAEMARAAADPDAVASALMKPTVQRDLSTMLIDGVTSAMADLLQIDWHRDVFTRPRLDQAPLGGPGDLHEAFFKIANAFLERLRTVTRSPDAAPLEPLRCFWVLQYLTDEGIPVEASTEFARGMANAPLSMHGVILNEAVWRRTLDIPRDRTMDRSLALLLDAQSLHTKIGPSIVLAATAVETRTEDVVNALAAESSVPSQLWAWLMDRGDFRKDPSEAELLDVVLRALTGHSLKDAPDLWEAFKNLRDARNSYVHEGHPLIGGREATPEVAERLLTRCESILEWLDQLVPPAQRILLPREAVTFVRAWGIGSMPGARVSIKGHGFKEEVPVPPRALRDEATNDVASALPHDDTPHD